MLKIKLGLAYLLHQLTANDRHGLHSPFVYRLVDKVIYDFSDKKVYHTLADARKRLPDDMSTAKGDRQQNKAITPYSFVSPRLLKLIYRLALNARPKTIVALGGFTNVASLYLQAAVPEADVFVFNKRLPTTASDIILQNKKINADGQPIEISAESPSLLIDGLPKLDFVFINSEYNKQVALQYFEWCLPRINQETVLIFSDIHLNKAMEEAWKTVEDSNQVTVTVDLFWMGLVYFKKGQAKENFKIKFSK